VPAFQDPDKKEEHKREYMKIRNMRSVLFLLLVCLVITGTATAISDVEFLSSPCAEGPYAGLPGGTGIAVVEVAGHADTNIDGQPAQPASVGTYKGYETRWYAAGEGTHIVTIFRSGVPGFNDTTTMPVCNGKVSNVYFDLNAHPHPAMTTTATTVVPTTTIVPTTTMTTYAGQSNDYGALKDALRTTAPTGSFGSLSVITDPAGATIFIDGVQQGISPATIPGISAGTHTMLLKRDGYQDLTLPVTITAGSTQHYSSALLKSGEVTMGTTIPRKSSMPGCGAVFAAGVAGALFFLRKTSP
jgi:hypothetical protein